MLALPFSKYHGLGNDFIIVDNRHNPHPLCSPAQAKQLCDRHFGVGADGVIFVLSGEVGCEFTMRIYNSDGSEPQMCGNGIRCFAKYLHDKSLVTTGRISVSTKAGPIHATLNEDGMIEVAMGRPILTPALIPTLFPGVTHEAVGNAVINASWKVTPLRTFHVTAVSMGNPHAVSWQPLLIRSVYCLCFSYRCRCRLSSLTTWMKFSQHFMNWDPFANDTICFQSVSTPSLFKYIREVMLGWLCGNVGQVLRWHVELELVLWLWRVC